MHPTKGQVEYINKQQALEAAVKWIIKVGRELMQVFLTDRYRPERYYMRGPGPRWRAKHHQERP